MSFDLDDLLSAVVDAARMVTADDDADCECSLCLALNRLDDYLEDEA